MKKALPIVVLLLVLILMEGVAWIAFKSSKEESLVVPKREPEIQAEPKQQQEQAADPKTEPTPNVSSAAPTSGTGSGEGSFPAPTTEVVNGRTERTIHMGVRQYAWDPPVIHAKQGELVRLIVHNADVQHGLVIPELNVLNIDIPPEGAVIEFVADKVGTFVFFCSYYCGEGHSEMRGKIIIQ